jgi:2'-5' RNA ligase
MLRTFIAVNPPLDILKRVKRIADYFQTQTPDEALKWSRIENYHLTLKFLGDTPEESLPQIKAILADAARAHPVFELTLEGLKFFPDVKKPRAVLLGIQDGRPLSALHKRLDTDLQPVGVPGDKRPFTPHLTLARVRRRTDPTVAAEIDKALSQFKVDPLGPFKIDKIHLYQSELTPKGPIYTTLFSSPLGAV